MTIINRTSKEVQIAHNTEKKDIHILVGGKTVMFTSMASQLCGITEGKYIHFINEDSDWSFYVDEDPDGFLPCVVDKRSKAKRINSSGLVIMILKSFGFNKSKKFAIEKTNLKIKGNPIFKLSLNVT